MIPRKDTAALLSQFGGVSAYYNLENPLENSRKTLMSAIRSSTGEHLTARK